MKRMRDYTRPTGIEYAALGLALGILALALLLSGYAMYRVLFGEQLSLRELDLLRTGVTLLAPFLGGAMAFYGIERAERRHIHRMTLETQRHSKQLSLFNLQLHNAFMDYADSSVRDLPDRFASEISGRASSIGQFYSLLFNEFPKTSLAEASVHWTERCQQLSHALPARIRNSWPASETLRMFSTLAPEMIATNLVESLKSRMQAGSKTKGEMAQALVAACVDALAPNDDPALTYTEAEFLPRELKRLQDEYALELGSEQEAKKRSNSVRQRFGTQSGLARSVASQAWKVLREHLKPICDRLVADQVEN